MRGAHMRMSLNELTAALKRSFEGIGFKPGDYEDAAQMVVWLEAHGLEGLQQIQRSFPELIQQPYTPLEITGEDSALTVIDAHNNSVLICASQAIDLAYSKACRKGSGVVQLQNCRNRKLIIERVVNCGRRGMSCLAHWRNGSERVTEYVVRLNSRDKTPDYRSYPTSHHETTKEQSLNIICADDVTLIDQYVNRELCQLPTENTSVTQHQLSDNYADSVERGIPVNAELLAILDELTKKILVESTDQSRQGAGD